MDGSAQMIGAVLARYAAELPDARLETLDERLKAFREANLDGLHIRVHQHQVVDHVRKRHTPQRDAQAVHVGEI